MTQFSPNTIRSRLRVYLTGQTPTGEKLSTPDSEYLGKIRTGIIIALNEALKLVRDGDQDQPEDVTNIRRHLVYGFIFGDSSEPLREFSTNELDPFGIVAIKNWIGSHKVDDPNRGKPIWIPRDGFVAEANEIANVCASWIVSEEKDKPLQVLLERLQAGHPESSRTDDNGLLTTGILIGGVVHSNPFNTGIELPVDSPDQLDDPDLFWCEWCGEYPSEPGVPCKSCAQLGAEASREPRYADLETGKKVEPGKPIGGEPTKPDNRPAWMRRIKAES